MFPLQCPKKQMKEGESLSTHCHNLRWKETPFANEMVPMDHVIVLVDQSTGLELSV